MSHSAHFAALTPGTYEFNLASQASLFLRIEFMSMGLEG
jgi:hypothetical protein